MGKSSRGKRITGTHVYTWLKCPTAVALDLHGDRSARRPLEDWEEFVRKRGRDFEEDYVSHLEVHEPQYDRGAFEVGAAETQRLMDKGVEWVFQGVLRWIDPADGIERLGLPDLMRKVDGESALGDHHYEVIDVKTSGRPRGDQILQVVFYSRILEQLQGRAPAEGGLILKDGREERFDVRAYRAALAEVEEGIAKVVAQQLAPEAMHSAECAGCSWSALCAPQLAERDDLSLIHGATRGLRDTLRAAGWSDVASLAQVPPPLVAKRAGLDGALTRRLTKAARARRDGVCLPEGGHRPPLARAVLFHLLTDPFAGRVLWMGALLVTPGEPPRIVDRFLGVDAEIEVAEWAAFQAILGELPGDVPLVHYGWELPSWYERHAFGRSAGLGAERRFVDLGRQLRGAAMYSGPVFGLAEHVRYGLGRDPHAAGNRRAVACWVDTDADGGRARVRQKGAADLQDLADLRAAFLCPDAVRERMRSLVAATPATSAAEAGSEAEA